ncbi:FAD-dependent oxidoreductase [Nocardia carnea]|uniref:FAD-dependent oxidoreductase n=1 Tax=Nocardia carnea TaxID=37328 RepID=UPI002454EB93|nr:FAD-dependent monooxygenase [Nocardia carnea]
MIETSGAVFERLLRAEIPADSPVLLGTACVLGGSVAGLLAARVLAAHSEQVVVVERDDIATEVPSRTGVPQEQQVHVLLPGGLAVIERLLPGFTAEAYALGAIASDSSATALYLDEHPTLRTEHEPLCLATRPFLEARIRAKVLELPNVRVEHARVTGVEFADGAVAAVRLHAGGADSVLAADFVVDAMGRSSKLADWLEAGGFERPELLRLHTGINYATALFERERADGDLVEGTTMVQYSPGRGPQGLALSVTGAVEDGRWIVMLMGHDEVKPPRDIETFRELCAGMPAPFPEAVKGAVVRDIVTYHQGDSRRRDYSAAGMPARLVSVGDAVASFNPAFGQGITSAALHSACLAEYLGGAPDLGVPAGDFFALQQVVVDAAWQVSAGSDAARLDARTGAEVPEPVRQQREILARIVAATVTDQEIAQVFRDVSFMLEHPDRLAGFAQRVTTDA